MEGKQSDFVETILLIYVHILTIFISSFSSGVYFNDSTKAVLSANSDSFVYIERRKFNKEGPNEPVASYTLSDYPEDTLKKKVTLLQHFRNYLSELQKHAEETEEIQPISLASTKSQSAGEMVYMKKWIKTKHAMLFRLSNGTVQVQFNDETQVLISSEGTLITFVDKEKSRTLYSISDIANNQQSDVSKRLKYAKEIISQIISGTKR
jgi:polo-like kinase 1